VPCPFSILHRFELSVARTTSFITDLDKNENFKFTKGSFDEMTNYMFGEKRLKHTFCPVCGCSAVGSDKNMKVVAVNLRAVEGVDAEKLKLKKIDGASL